MLAPRPCSAGTLSGRTIGRVLAFAGPVCLPIQSWLLPQVAARAHSVVPFGSDHLSAPELPMAANPARDSQTERDGMSAAFCCVTIPGQQAGARVYLSCNFALLRKRAITDGDMPSRGRSVLLKCNPGLLVVSSTTAGALGRRAQRPSGLRCFAAVSP